MILDDLSAAERYFAVHPGFPAAFEFLRRADWKNLPLGRHDIEGDALFVLIAKDPGRGRYAAPLEAHQRYIDIQYVVSGIDEMGWRRRADCQEVRTPHSDEKDIAFWNDRPTSWFEVPSGSFAIFFPADAHAPLAGRTFPHKAVVKVAVNWQPTNR